jgi:hypothetical protein
LRIVADLIEKSGKGDLVSNYYPREAAHYSFEPSGWTAIGFPFLRKPNDESRR